MATKNDMTGDTLISRVSNKNYNDGWDRIFGKKSQKEKQQDMTELNGDGNRERGRNGEDLKNN
mgnify:FL=1|jgi:hypothetical protein|tara:strand:+ start:790 stop:978 length:189 start_codon:yes stop_codon:yes gene_type:complete